ncbi:MAG: hypothetical protein HKN45_00560, partial [Flavobacteriales bacterium]|nr:hypothetical protein [Flavobacteriales bacterium]
MKQLYCCPRIERGTIALTRLFMTLSLVIAFVLTGTAANSYIEDTEAPATLSFVEDALSSVETLSILSATLDATTSDMSFAEFSPSFNNLLECDCPEPDAAPVLSLESQTIVLECGDILPSEGPVVTATDECDGDVEVITFPFPYNYTGVDNSCAASDAIGVNPDYWAVWLPVLNQFTDQWRFLPGENGAFVEYADNTALITGVVQSVENPGRKFRLHVTLQGNYDWPTWNSMMTVGNPQVNRTYKDAYGFGAMDDNFMDWSYYTIDPDHSFLLGEDEFEGAYLLLDHAPSNFLFGTQVGLGANDTNGNFGLSTWFVYEGFIPDADGDLVATSGQGDINIDLDCGIPFDICDMQQSCFGYVAIDDCGNHDFEQICYQIPADVTAPVFDNCPDDMTVECGNVPEVADVTATDECGSDVTISFEENTAGGDCPQESTITREWTATDQCGNSDVCTQVITVVDTTAPQFTTTAEDATIECDDPFPAAPDMMADDNCDDDVEITMASSITNDVDCPLLEVTTRTWTATDDCGNTVTTSQTITVQDTTAPSISCPDDATVECGSSTDVDATGLAQASDACGGVIVTWTDGPTSGNCPSSFTRTFTATDDCGNTATCDQLITIVDTNAPVLSGGSSGTANVECDEALPQVESPTASDICDGDVSVTPSVEENDNNSCAGSIVYTWTATDACGNSAVQTFTILIQDTTAPEIECPEDATYACEDEVPPLVEPTASDNCDEDVDVECFEINLSEEGSELCLLENPGIPEPGQNWSIFLPGLPNDVSSNFVWDADGADMYVFNDELYITGHVVNEDDASYGFTVNLKANNKVDWDGWNGQLTTLNPFIPRTYKDDYGHAAAGGMLWNTWDFYEINPVGSNLIGTGGFAGSFLNMTHAPNNYLFGLQVGEAANNKTPGYGLSSWFSIQGSINGEAFSGQGDISSDADCNNPFTACSYEILRICTATDDCGNGDGCVQVITVTDDVNPTIECPEDITVECTESTEPSNTGMATGEDNCGDVIITYIDSPVEGSCPASFQRAWKATDECENTVVCIQTISIADTTPPELTINPDATVECGDDFDLAGASATDNCSVPTVESDSSFVADCGDTGVWTITYTATDDCGNSTVDAQTITIVDTTSPVITPMPLEITAECDDIPDAAPGEATDICGDVTINLVELGYSGGCQGALQRTYTATDECGNTSTFIQIVNIIDTTPPTITAAADETLECTEVIPEPSAEAADNCGGATWTVSASTEEMCGVTYTMTRVYTATDECGNTSQDTQVITVVDTTPPLLDGIPADTEAECDNIDRSDIVNATDNCDGDIPFDYEEIITNEICEGTYTLTRIWSAVDACGNS